jgi:predicted pyridoxine 5'-phosphate oxidase superfamily flavin-nucleotide-binding protein
MGILTADMKRIVEEQRLGFVATVDPDGAPSLSPKGTLAVWDGDHLIFADIRSPRTVANLKANPAVEVNVVDPFARKGYRFKGVATVLSEGPPFDSGVSFFRQRAVLHAIQHVVMIEVRRALPLTSPAYDLGATEEQVRVRWEDHFASLSAGTPRKDGE